MTVIALLTTTRPTHSIHTSPLSLSTLHNKIATVTQIPKKEAPQLWFHLGDLVEANRPAPSVAMSGISELEEC